MPYKGIVPAIDAFTGRHRTKEELERFAPSDNSRVQVYRPDEIIACYMNWAETALDNLLDEAGNPLFDTIVAPPDDLGGVLFPKAFKALFEKRELGQLDFCRIDPNFKASWWHDRKLFADKSRRKVLVTFDQFSYPPDFSDKYFDPREFLDKLSLANLDVVASVGMYLNPDLDTWGSLDLNYPWWSVAFSPRLNPGMGNWPLLYDSQADPIDQVMFSLVRRIMEGHFLNQGQPKFDLIVAPALPLSGIVVPFFIQKFLATLEHKMPVRRLETYSPAKDQLADLAGKKVLIALDAFYETPTLRRHCGGNEYFNTSHLHSDLTLNGGAEVVGTIGLFNYGHWDDSGGQGIYPVVVWPK